MSVNSKDYHGKWKQSKLKEIMNLLNNLTLLVQLCSWQLCLNNFMFSCNMFVKIKSDFHVKNTVQIERCSLHAIRE